MRQILLAGALLGLSACSDSDCCCSAKQTEPSPAPATVTYGQPPANTVAPAPVDTVTTNTVVRTEPAPVLDLTHQTPPAVAIASEAVHRYRVEFVLPNGALLLAARPELRPRLAQVESNCASGVFSQLEQEKIKTAREAADAQAACWRDYFSHYEDLKSVEVNVVDLKPLAG